MPRRIETHLLTGPVGRIEALLEEPDDRDPRVAAVVCHPHPLYGGTMHNKVVFRMARGLRSAGVVVLRFNFRGVGMSEGEHGNLTGEIEDARCALAWLRERYPHLGFALAGFSFGSRVITRLGCTLDNTKFLMAAGFPTSALGQMHYLETCPAPKIFIQSTQDQFGPRHDLEMAFTAFAEPKQLVWVEAQDHFFTGALDELESNAKKIAERLVE